MCAQGKPPQSIPSLKTQKKFKKTIDNLIKKWYNKYTK